MKAFLELFRDAIGRWWVEASFLRKIGDVIVAIMLCAMLMAYNDRDHVWHRLTANPGGYVLDHDMAKGEAQAFLDSVGARQVFGVFVLEINLDEARRGVIAHAATSDAAALINRLAVLYRDVPLIDTPPQYNNVEYQALLEGRSFWSPGPTLPVLRFVVPIPPLIGERTVGMIVVMCDPKISDSDRGFVEGRALKWAKRMSGL